MEPIFFLHLVNTELAQKPLEFGKWQTDTLEYIHSELAAIKPGNQKNIFVAIAGGRGTGKTTLACFLALWLVIMCHDRYAFCRMYANTEAQLKNALLATLKNMVNSLDLHSFVRESGLLAVKSTARDQNEISARVWSKSNYSSVRGEHGDLTVRVFDECSGIPDQVFHTIISGETCGNNINIMLGNPVVKSGFFYDIFHGSTSFNFFKKHVSVFECAHINPESDSVKQMGAACNELDSSGDLYRVEMLGQFPMTNSYLFFGTSIDITEIQERDLPYITSGIIGVDIASGSGEDYTVIAHRIQGLIYIRFFGKISLPDLKNKLYNIYAGAKVPICVDAVGIGIGLRQELLSLGVPVNPIIGNEASYDTRSSNRRSELYLKLKEFFDSGGRVACSHQEASILRRELNEIVGEYDDKGKISIISKKKMKKSPDILDALSYTFHQNLRIVRSFGGMYN